MAALTGNSVASSYQGLIKFNDNGTVQPTTLKTLSDGTGGSLPLSLSQVETKFTSGTIVDFTGVTVNGLPGGEPGLVAGVGTDSMKSADTLTTVSSIADGARSIAIGDGAIANSDGTISIGSVSNVPPAPRLNYIAIGQDIAIAQNSIAIGKGTNAQSDRALAMVEGAQVNSDFGIVIGYNALASGYAQSQTVIGNGATSDSQGNIAIGLGAQALGGGGFERTNICIGNGQASNERSIAIGHQTIASGSRSVAISENANASGLRSVAIGQNAQSTGFNSVACGAYTQATAEGAFTLGGYNAIASALYAGAIGRESTANLAGGVAIGYQVTTLWEYATTVNQLAVKNYAALNFADDTAAATGGVPLGGIYQTSGALKIRIA